MFGRLGDWRRIATRYDRRPAVFFSAVALAATVIFWLEPMSPDPSTLPSACVALTDDARGKVTYLFCSGNVVLRQE